MREGDRLTLNLEQVATFLALVRAGSFRAAARERGLTQGAVSQQLRKLEIALGVALIARAARGCVPTRDGAQFLRYAESLMRLNANAVAALRNRCVTLGASSNIGVYFLQPYLKAFMELHEGRCALSLRVDQNPVLAENIGKGEIDVAAMEWWDDRPGYVARCWRSDELVVIVPPDHPWARRSAIPPGMLKEAPILGGEPGTGTARVLARYLGDAAQGLDPVLRLGSTEAVKRGVKVGLGVSLVLLGTVLDERRDGSLVAIPLEGERPQKNFYIVWPDSLLEDSAPRRFADWLVNQPFAAPSPY
ncbi:MAG: LysR family transcriptional regulator [Betaproteobacteria bacterium]|nr:LysR family transcriptional regulator [Betaproteobacteria bacterium]